MSDFKARLLEEKQQLDDRRIKLEFFLGTPAYRSIPAAQQTLLSIQAPIMAAYSQVLAERIAALEPVPE